MPDALNVPDARIYEILPDGTELVIRPLCSNDRELLRDGFALLGEDSRYQRFFTPKLTLRDDELNFLSELDGDEHHALCIVAWDEQGHELPVGVARYVRIAPRSEIAEAAITIVDSMQRRGLGKLLLRRLADAAYRRGVRRFRADVLGTNAGALRLVRTLDETARPRMIEGGIEQIEVVLPPPSDEPRPIV